MTRYLLDTNIISEVIRRPRGPVGQRVNKAESGSLLTSIIVAAEARFGAAKARSTRLNTRLDELFAIITVEPFGEPAELRYAELRASLERRGTPIGANDLFIAAHALALDCILVTGNVGEFERVEGLRCQNWLRSAESLRAAPVFGS